MKKFLGLIFVLLVLGVCGLSAMSSGVADAGGCYSPNCPTDTPTLTQTITATLTEIFTHTPTSTATVTETSTATVTETSTETSTATVTETSTSTATATATGTSTNTPTVEVDPSPTRTDKPTLTNTPTLTYTPTVETVVVINITSTDKPTLIPTETSTKIVSPSDTPYPPKPAEAFEDGSYPGQYIGKLRIDGGSYNIYHGVNASNGSLMLPSGVRGGARYENVIWIHRLWKEGWLEIYDGSIVHIAMVGWEYVYEVSNVSTEPYGKYFTDKDKLYIASCYSDDLGNWAGIELYELTLIDTVRQ